MISKKGFMTDLKILTVSKCYLQRKSRNHKNGRAIRATLKGKNTTINIYVFHKQPNWIDFGRDTKFPRGRPGDPVEKCGIPQEVGRAAERSLIR